MYLYRLFIIVVVLLLPLRSYADRMTKMLVASSRSVVASKSLVFVRGLAFRPWTKRISERD